MISASLRRAPRVERAKVVFWILDLGFGILDLKQLALNPKPQIPNPKSKLDNLKL
jgi:hypothetical protein